MLDRKQGTEPDRYTTNALTKRDINQRVKEVNSLSILILGADGGMRSIIVSALVVYLSSSVPCLRSSIVEQNKYLDGGLIPYISQTLKAHNN